MINGEGVGLLPGVRETPEGRLSELGVHGGMRLQCREGKGEEEGKLPANNPLCMPVFFFFFFGHEFCNSFLMCLFVVFTRGNKIQT